jgi:hypothetical protein
MVTVVSIVQLGQPGVVPYRDMRFMAGKIGEEEMGTNFIDELGRRVGYAGWDGKLGGSILSHERPWQLDVGFLIERASFPNDSIRLVTKQDVA